MFLILAKSENIILYFHRICHPKFCYLYDIVYHFYENGSCELLTNDFSPELD